MCFRLVGLLYLVSGGWCVFRPELAAGFLGFTLAEPIGLVEFVAVYGGLQLGIAAAIFVTAANPGWYRAGIVYSLVLSVSLLVCRAVAMVSWGSSPELFSMLVVEGAIVAMLAWAFKQAPNIESNRER